MIHGDDETADKDGPSVPGDPHDDPETSAERLQIKSTVRTRLLLLSGNRCAWTTCKQALAPEEGGMFGEIAHIRAAEKSGPRFDATMTNNERRGFDNLLLLCGKHHTLIDHVDTWHQYPRADLEEIKRLHEAPLLRALDDLGRAEEEYVDHTRGTAVVHCTTLKRMYGAMLDEENRLGTVESVNKIANHLGTVTRAARQLLCDVVEKNEQMGVAEAARRSHRPRREIYDLLDELMRLHLAEVYPDEFAEPGDPRQRIVLLGQGVWSHNPVFDYPFWRDLRKHVDERDDLRFADLIVGLDFSLLD